MFDISCIFWWYSGAPQRNTTAQKPMGAPVALLQAVKSPEEMEKQVEEFPGKLGEAPVYNI